jgi:anti-anti-sigma factor
VNKRAGDDAVSGRGLSIYSAYCSRVRFNHRGNAVVLMRRIKTKINMETHRILKTDEGVKIEMCADLVSSVVPELRTQALEHLRAGAKSVGVDLKACAMVDSAGIGLLIAIHNSLAKSGGRLKLSGVSEDVRGLFRAMRLDQHFDMAD